MTKEFDAFIEQVRYDSRFGNERVLLRNIHYGKHLVRNHMWITVNERIGNDLKRRIRKTIRFQAKPYLYIDVETGKKTKQGLKKIRRIRLSQFNLRNIK